MLPPFPENFTVKAPGFVVVLNPTPGSLPCSIDVICEGMSGKDRTWDPSGQSFRFDNKMSVQ